MTTRASVAKHPIHPMLVPFPIGLWVFSLIADIILATGGGPLWGDVAFYTMLGGTIGAAFAAVPGLIDFLSIREPTASRIGVIHMVLNVAALLLFVANLGLRLRYAPGSALLLTLSAIGIGLIVVSGWLGGELVYVHGVGIEPQRTVSGATEIRVEKRDQVRRA